MHTYYIIYLQKKGNIQIQINITYLILWHLYPRRCCMHDHEHSIELKLARNHEEPKILALSVLEKTR